MHDRHSPASSGSLLGGIALSILAGLSLPLQSRVNGALAAELDDSVAAAAVSFGTGFVLLAGAALAHPAARRGLARLRLALRERTLPVWYLLAGVLGAWLVVAQSISVRVFGVALFSIALIAGQTVGGLLVDRLGFPRSTPRPLNATRIGAAALTVVAVAWSVSGGLQAGASPVTTALVALLPLSAGVLSGFQQGLNGFTSTVTRAPFAATFMNFLVGTTALIVVTVVLRLGAQRPLVPAMPGVWWMYLGGALGIVFIFSGAFLVPRIGVLRFTVTAVAGQLTGSLLLDVLWPAAGSHVTVATIGGTLLTFAAIAWSSAPDLRRARRVSD